MRVVVYSRAFPPSVGGLERFAEDLAGWLTERGHEVVVVTRSPSSGPGSSRDYQVVREPSPSRLHRAMRAADVVHVNGLSVRGVAAAAAAGRRPVVTHQGHQAVCPTGLAWHPSGSCDAGPRSGPCASCPTRRAIGRPEVRAHRLASSLSRINVAVSAYLLRRLGLPRATAIYNPVAARAFDVAAVPAADRTIGFAGRLVPEKGLDLLIRTLALLPSAKLRVVGDGPMLGPWSRLAAELGVADRIRFLGPGSFDEVAGVYGTSSVVCVPSVWPEPFGYAVAEAMAMGCAVAATPVGAIPELLAEGRGEVATSADPAALALSLERLLTDAALRAQMGERARAFARTDLAIERLGERYLDVYRSHGG